MAVATGRRILPLGEPAATLNAMKGEPPDFFSISKAYLESQGYAVTKRRGDQSFQEFLGLVRDTRSNYEGQRQEARKALKEKYRSEYQTTSGSWQGSTVKAAMSEVTGTGGGYLLPMDYSLALMDVIAEESFLWPRATVVPMATAEMTLPRFDVETATTTLGVSSLLAGIQFKWGSEQAPLETEPKFRALSLKALDLLGYAFISNQMLADTGTEGEEALLNMFGRAAAWYAELAFLSGGGLPVLQPQGVTNAPATLVVTRQTTATVTIQDITKMTAALLPYSWGNAIWAMNPSCLTPIQSLSSYFVNIELGGLHKKARRAAGVLSTMPVFITEKLPVVGQQGDICLFDPTLYVIGNRMECLVDVSPDDRFQQNQSTYRVWLRVDGRPRLSSTVKLADNKTMVSPYVVLSTL